MKDKIINNQFIDKLRISGVVDESDYSELCEALRLLANELRDSVSIDRELAGYLYNIPLIVRNTFLALSATDIYAEKLEDIWLELDGLVTDCFFEN